MLSKMAEEDIKYLQGLGVTLTPSQIVRLNSLALQVEFGPESSSFIHAPRVAWASGTPLFEPTIQVQIWLRDFALTWWDNDALTLALAWACAHARESDGYFLSWTDERKTRKEIERWQRGLTCTFGQLTIALDYALNGVPQDKQEASQDTPEQHDGCPYTDIIADAMAAGLGVSVSELQTMPRRVVFESLRRWMKNRIALAGGNPDSLVSSGATMAYCAYEDYLTSITPENKPNG